MGKNIEVQAPNHYDLSDGKKKIFLAGSIEMGKAEDWQTRLVKECKNKDLVFLNPRRDDWDSSWDEDLTDKNFVNQVSWELQALEDADYIACYIDPETKSPITLLEIGLHARSGKMIICCPDGFFKKGNIDVTAIKYGVETVDSIEELIKSIDEL